MPNFDVGALDALVTSGMMDAAMLKGEIEHKHEAKQVGVDGRDLAAQASGVKGVSSIAVKETKAVEALPEVVVVAPTREDAEVALAKEDTGLAEAMSAEMAH